MLIAYFAFGVYPFGEKSVLVASNNSNYLTHYYELYDFISHNYKEITATEYNAATTGKGDRIPLVATKTNNEITRELS